MKAIFRGRRYFVVAHAENGVWLEALSMAGNRRVHVPVADPDLILDPADEDIDLPEAYERGEVNAFEYPDGHTYPSGREIVGPARRRPLMFRRH